MNIMKNFDRFIKLFFVVVLFFGTLSFVSGQTITSRSVLTEFKVGETSAGMSFSPSYWSNNPYVYIDYNNDGDFLDVGETISFAAGNGPFNFTLTPPEWSVLGTRNLRIKVSNDAGGTEDYSITISSDPTLTTNISDIPLQSYCFGNGPSSTESFDLDGTSLTDDVIITPPENYEISIDQVDWISKTSIPSILTVDGASGSISETVYVRLISDLVAAD